MPRDPFWPTIMKVRGAAGLKAARLAGCGPGPDMRDAEADRVERGGEPQPAR
jgi:hypothetical protein